MKERILQLLDLEQLSPSKFADIIGVQRSSVSHVISGRNNPSFDFLQKTLKAFPGLNAEWLMLGQGTMYEQMGRTPSGSLFDTPGTPKEDVDYESPEPVDQSDYSSETESRSEEEHPTVTDEPDQHTVTRRIVRVVLLYSDDTFASFEPS